MTDEELAAIEARAKDQDRLGSTADPATVLALVAEVRRLRDGLLTLADELDAEGTQPWRPDVGEEPAYYHGLSEAAECIRRVLSS